MRLEKQGGQIISGSCRPREEVWVSFREQRGTPEWVHTGTVCSHVCLKKIALAAEWSLLWAKASGPTGRPWGKPWQESEEELDGGVSRRLLWKAAWRRDATTRPPFQRATMCELSAPAHEHTQAQRPIAMDLKFAWKVGIVN